MHTIILQKFYNHVATNMKLENLLTGGPPSGEIPVERNPVYGGGDGVVTLKNPAYSLPTGLQPASVSQSLPAATDGEGQQKNAKQVD